MEENPHISKGGGETVRDDTPLNDTTIRLVMIPLFGLLIPNVTGLIHNSVFSPGRLVIAYVYFMFISFAIWQGNRFLLFRIRPRFSWLEQPVRKIIALIISNVFYTIPITTGLLVLWYGFAGAAIVDWDAIFKAVALCVICVVFITHVYETVFLIQRWESDLVRTEKLERGRAEAELEALRNQIDPHFIFNSLNTLSHLIETDPVSAKQFNDNLADMYRYILAAKDRDLVLLREEIAFLKMYYSLLRIRFGDSLELLFDLPSSEEDSFLLPPISLQLLLENAVKHNELNPTRPLHVTCRLLQDANGARLILSNEKRPRVQLRTSSRVGLTNLAERYTLLTNQTIGIDDGVDSFSVTLPLIRVA